MNTPKDHYKYENLAIEAGQNIIAGGDEAGRGPWAGPVYAAFVVLNTSLPPIEGLNDSKKLSKKQRAKLFEEIREKALAYAVGTASEAEIDRFNILEATRLAFKRAFDKLTPKPNYVLLDYIKLPWLKTPHRAFVNGETISASVAAASIVAKESRDLYMKQLAQKYPQYGFEKHMGYGTKAHLEALKKFGPCPAHRKSYKPVKALLNDYNLFCMPKA